MVSRLRDGGAVDRAANIPGRLWGGPTGGDHQGAGHALQGPDQADEPQLHRVQVPPDKGLAVGEGLPCQDAPRCHRLGGSLTGVHSEREDHTHCRVRPQVLR